ncbi:MAG: DUF2018 family protein [Campylobacterota bacterium]|nr:DUF2018 family protein [Campylobacterota bacterium]
MGKFDALFEDDDNIFAGSPKSKFWDFYNKLSQDLAEDEFDKIVEKIAVMEMMLQEHMHEDDIDRQVKQYALQNFDTLDERKKSVYIELAAELLFQFDS